MRYCRQYRVSCIAALQHAVYALTSKSDQSFGLWFEKLAFPSPVPMVRTAHLAASTMKGAWLERVDIHRVQICALTIDSMDMNALGVCS